MWKRRAPSKENRRISTEHRQDSFRAGVIGVLLLHHEEVEQAALAGFQLLGEGALRLSAAFRPGDGPTGPSAVFAGVHAVGPFLDGGDARPAILPNFDSLAQFRLSFSTFLAVSPNYSPYFYKPI